MSEMEYNKGTLIPSDLTLEDLAKKYVPDEKYFPQEVYSSRVEMLMDDWGYYLDDEGILLIKGKPYTVKYEIEGQEWLEELANIEQEPDGSIKFETYHYNGGGNLEEVIESKL